MSNLSAGLGKLLINRVGLSFSFPPKLSYNFIEAKSANSGVSKSNAALFDKGFIYSKSNKRPKIKKRKDKSLNVSVKSKFNSRVNSLRASSQSKHPDLPEKANDVWFIGEKVKKEKRMNRLIK